MDANFAFKYHAYLISIIFIHLIFYFHSCEFSILTHFDTLNVGFVGTLSYVEGRGSKAAAPMVKKSFKTEGISMSILDSGTRILDNGGGNLCCRLGSGSPKLRFGSKRPESLTYITGEFIFFKKGPKSLPKKGGLLLMQDLKTRGILIIQKPE